MRNVRNKRRRVPQPVRNCRQTRVHPAQETVRKPRVEKKQERHGMSGARSGGVWQPTSTKRRRRVATSAKLVSQAKPGNGDSKGRNEEERVKGWQETP